MLNIIHKIVANPLIYDFCQWLAGASVNKKFFREEFASLPEKGCVLDVGGGTGLSRPLLPAGWNYCCLDPDPQKLKGFRAKYPRDESVQASACNIPLPNESFDLCIMIAVSHHLTDEEFRLSLCEIHRLLRPGGKFILMDAVWNPSNIRSRLLWFLDRGSYPKQRHILEGFVSNIFPIISTKKWKVHHEYVLFMCVKNN
jgi:SAM-dependent methyltransferase